jgi:glycosyltransferase involved in cell wall biosynthesis
MTSSYPIRPGDFAGNFVEDIALGIVKLGHSVYVVTPRYLDASSTESSGDLHVLRFAVSGQKEHSSLADLKGPIGWLELTILMVQMLRCAVSTGKKFNVDLIHAYWVLPSGLVALIAGRLLRKPLIVTSLGTDLRIAPKNPLVRALVTFVLKRIDHCIGLSSDLEIRALALGLDPSRSSVIPDGVRVDLFTQLSRNRSVERRKLRLGSADIILYVGRLHRAKGLEYLVEALSILSKTNSKITLLLAGDGPEKTRLSRLAMEKSVSRLIRFLGPVPHFEIPNLISLADVCVLPSLSEGLPTFVQEAMFAGKPIVATEVGGIPDMITNRSTGLLVKPSDPSALANAILAILRDRPFAERLGRNARRFAEANLTTEITARKISRIYEDVAGNPLRRY